MALLPSQVDDFVNLTISLYKRNKWTDISTELQEYVGQALYDEKKVVEQGGPDIKFTFVHKAHGNFTNTTGLYSQDTTSVEDVTVQGTVPWAKSTANWSYDIDEPLFQSDNETIIDILKVREHACLVDWAEGEEENVWSEPSSSTDTRPMGIPFWVRKDATTTPAGAFSGGNPTATGLTTGCAGISTTTYPRWDNWTFGYTTISQTDGVKKMKKAMVFTKFKPPVPHPELGYGPSERQIYTTYDVQEQLERMAENRNQNLGSDVARYMNAVTVGGVPVNTVFWLESNDSTDPIYGLNFKYLRPYVKKGCDMRRSPLTVAPKQHTVRTVFIDTWRNYVCVNRRTQWVGSTS